MKPKIPKGWRRLQVGEIAQLFDRYTYPPPGFVNGYLGNEVEPGGLSHPGKIIRKTDEQIIIRRVAGRASTRK